MKLVRKYLIYIISSIIVFLGIISMLNLDHSKLEFRGANGYELGRGAIFSRDLRLPSNFWGTFIEGDGFRGELVSNLHPVRSEYLGILVTGGGYHRGNRAIVQVLEQRSVVDEITFQGTDPNESYRIWIVDLRAHSGREYRLVLHDSLDGIRSWVGVGEKVFETSFPWLVKLQYQSNFSFVGYSALAIVHFLLFLMPGLVINYYWDSGRIQTGTYLPILKVLAFSFFVSYVLFWVFLFSPDLAKSLTLLVTVGCFGFLWFHRLEYKRFICSPKIGSGLVLVIVSGIFYLGTLFFYHNSNSPNVANDRFLQQLPIDNEIPYFFAKCLFTQGFGTADCFHESMGRGIWRSSDRPPLFSAVLAQLMAFNPGRVDSMYQYTGTIIQSTWVLGVLALAQFFRLNRAQRVFFVGSMVFSGFSILNTAFLWPKMITLSMFALGFILFLGYKNPGWKNVFLIGISWSLATLMHGGIQFTILAVAAIFLLSIRRTPVWKILGIVAVYGIVSVPWGLYKKYYDPPGNHLEVMRIAGQRDDYLDIDLYPGQLRLQDGQSTLSAIVDSYQRVPVEVIFENKKSNFVTPFEGISQFGDYIGGFFFTEQFESHGIGIRGQSFLYTWLALGLSWVLVLGIFVPTFWGRNFHLRQSFSFPQLSLVFILSYTLWAVIMFEPHATLIHQGSYATIPLALLVLSMVGRHLPGWVLYGVFGLNLLWNAVVWLIPVGSQSISDWYIMPVSFSLASLGGILYILLNSHRTRREKLHLVSCEGTN